MAAAKVPTDLFTDLSVHDRTFIIMVEALITSGNYLPGPLIMQIAQEATDQIMIELGFSTAASQPRVTSFWRAQGR